MAKDKIVFRDVLHGDIVFSSPVKEVIDHKLFQRLKYIYQNGICYQIFPGMTHSRFQHSLGVAHLASEWINSLSVSFSAESKFWEDFKDSKTTEGFELKIEDSKRVLQQSLVDEDLKNTVILAALTHDLGHGPFSHLLEEIEYMPSSDIYHDYTKRSQLSQYADDIVALYIEDKYVDHKNRVDHEDLTLIYLSYIFNQLSISNDYFRNTTNLYLACALISKDFRKFAVREEKAGLSAQQKKFVMIFSELVSGFIDVDRLDYILRDSMMAGVNYGKIELSMILRDLIPIYSERGDEMMGGFISKYKYHPMIDHFIFNLFELYSQVIYHPKAMAMNHELGILVNTLKPTLKDNMKELNFIDWHINSHDLSFIAEIKNADPSLSGKVIDKILHRHADYKNNDSKLKTIYNLPEKQTLPKKLKNDEFKKLPTHPRKLLKDNSRIWLTTQQDKEITIYDWRQISPIAVNLSGHSYAPNFWWRNENFLKDIEDISKRLEQKRAQQQKDNKAS